MAWNAVGYQMGAFEAALTYAEERVQFGQEEGVSRDDHAALAKAVVTSRGRETVAWARELFGGNGILLENDVVRFFDGAGALYSYEGTREIDHLIVGRGLTGHSAFV